jgi:hypothetical protein
MFKMIYMQFLSCHVPLGLTNSTYFAEIQRIRAGPNSKIAKNTVNCFKISKKDKNQQKYVKKTRSNSKVTGEEIFCKNRSFGLIKFKFCQIYLNLLKRVRWNQLFITHLLFIRPNYRPIRSIIQQIRLIFVF